MRVFILFILILAQNVLFAEDKPFYCNFEGQMAGKRVTWFQRHGGNTQDDLRPYYSNIYAAEGKYSARFNNMEFLPKTSGSDGVSGIYGAYLQFPNAPILNISFCFRLKHGGFTVALDPGIMFQVNNSSITCMRATYKKWINLYKGIIPDVWLRLEYTIPAMSSGVVTTTVRLSRLETDGCWQQMAILTRDTDAFKYNTGGNFQFVFAGRSDFFIDDFRVSPMESPVTQKSLVAP